MNRTVPAVLLTAALCAGALVAPVSAAGPIGHATPIVDPGHAGLARYFAALRRAEQRTAGPTGVARALHYGDSTIAGDGLARTVRARLAARFGDAGPGFVSASLNPKWSARADVRTTRTGGWDWRTILLGGGGGRYGLGGVVGILSSGARGTLTAIGAGPGGAVAGAKDAPAVPQRHVELWYQAGAGYGTVTATADGVEILRASAAAAATEDRRFVVDLAAPASQVGFGASGGTVPVYGAVLETGQPGTTWEALGVIGVGSRSFTTYAGAPLAAQMAQRKPDLVVVMLGGNEAGYPTLTTKGGAGYLPIYEGALKTILAGAAGASCLVLTPLDQGYVDTPAPDPAASPAASPAAAASPSSAASPGSAAASPASAASPAPAAGSPAASPAAPKGTERARPGMRNLVAQQALAASHAGCAFWSSWDAMGGEGSALVWAHTRGMGTGDLVHLTPTGLERIGNLLSDALLADYDAWSAGR